MSAAATLMTGQAKWVEESSTAWKLEDAHVRNVRVVEFLIPSVVNVVRFLREEVRASWLALRASLSTYPAQEKGEELAESFRVILRAFDALDKCVQMSEATGFDVEGVEGFRAAHRDLVSLHVRFEDGWPMLDAKAAEAASARIASGQFVALEDLARALDGSL